MFSDLLKTALEADVIGQPRAVNSVVQGVTRAVSGLVSRDGPLCAYMFMGPSGTGKTHLVQTLARKLHGDESRLIVADCTHIAHDDPWTRFAIQIAPLFAVPQMASKWSVLETPPLSIILVEYLERGRHEVVRALTSALETGQLHLPEGRRGSLSNCFMFFTSGLCAREISDEGPRIGFSGTQDEEEGVRAKIFRTCHAAAQRHYGSNLLTRIDDLIVFHKLHEEYLGEILEQNLRNLNQWLVSRGCRCELLPGARSFLLDRGLRDQQPGARDLLRAHRRFLEFPVADLVVSGRIPMGGLLVVDRRLGEDHLHFTVSQPESDGLHVAHDDTESGNVPVVWDEANAAVFLPPFIPKA